MPSIRTAPEVASKSRGTSDSSVVLPDPVLPMIAVVRPGSGVEGHASQDRLAGARVGQRHVAQLEPAAARHVHVTGGGRYHRRLGIEHLPMRSADTAARGAMTSTKVRHHHRHEDLQR